MTVFELTRTLIDIESITGNEARMGEYVFAYLSAMAARFEGKVEKMDCAPDRFNVLATFGDPVVTLSTHLDTVPPFFASREDGDFIWGRGACDVKGIIACMLLAAERVLAEGARGVALLFVVGEERNSLGAYTAAKHNRGSKFIINGEPTENQLALGSKGALRYEVTASGRMAHSAYPELGESAINKLLDALQRMRQVPMPVNEILGPSTLNIGVIAGGRAPNVISDHAKAEILIRLVDDGEAIKQGIREAAQGEVDVAEVVCIPALHLGAVEGFRTTVVSYTTDIPAFQGAWGQPYLIGPGTIHVAHTSEERVPKRELVEAVELYSGLVRRLLQ